MTGKQPQRFSHWFRRVLSPSPRRRPTPSFVRLDVEQLTERLAPAVVLKAFDVPFAPGSAFEGGGFNQLVGGADGNVWYDLSLPGAIGRMTPDGQFTQFDIPSSPFGPTIVTMAAGQDGNVWYVVQSVDFGGPRLALGKITPAGVATEVAMPAEYIDYLGIGDPIRALTRIQEMVQGPDGNFWFMDVIANRVGRIALDGTVTEFGQDLDFLPYRGGFNTADLIAGPGNKMWFTEPNQAQVGYIDVTTGAVTEYTFPTQEAALWMTVTPQGKLWAAQINGDTTEFAADGSHHSLGLASAPGAIARDGNLWIPSASGFAMIDANGNRTTYATYFQAFPFSSKVDWRLVPVSDGGLWFYFKTLDNGRWFWQIVRLDIDTVAPAPFTEVFPATVNAGDILLDPVVRFTDFELKPGFDPDQERLYSIIDYGDGTPPRHTYNVQTAGIGKYEIRADHRYTQGGTFVINAALTNVKPEQDGDPLPPAGIYVLSNAEVPVISSFPPEVLFVRQVYRDVLHREPEIAGRQYWTDLLYRGRSRQEVVAAIQASPEAHERSIDDLYRAWLGRAAEPVGIDAWMRLLDLGHSISDVQAGILASEEFWQRNGGSVDGYLTGLYQAVLDRTPEALGMDAWTQALADGQSRGEVAAQVLTSSEARTRLVADAYQDLLDRAADAQGADDWQRFLDQGHTVEEFLGAVVASDEYFATHAPAFMPGGPL